MSTEPGQVHSVHALVQAVVRRDLGDEEVALTATVAFLLVVGALPQEDVEDVSTWPIFDALLPHFLAVNRWRPRRLGPRGLVPRLAAPVSLLRVGSYLMVRGRLDDAARLIRECLELGGRRRRGEWGDLRVAALSRLGDLAYLRGDLDAGEAAFATALNVARGRFGRGSIQHGLVLNARGLRRFEVGRHADAADDHRASIESYLGADDALPEHFDTAQHNLGRAIGRLGQLDEALDLLNASLKTEAGRQHPLAMASALSVQSQHLLRLGDAEGSRDAAQRAVDMLESTLPTMEHQALAQSLSTLSDALAGTGDFAGAIDALSRTLDIERRLHGNRHFEVASTSVKLAALMCDIGDLAHAEPVIDEALAFFDGSPGDYLEFQSFALITKGRVIESRDPQAAVALHQRAIGIAERNRGGDPAALVQVVLSLARLHARARDRVQAAHAYRRTIELAEGRGYPSLEMQRQAQRELETIDD